MPTDLLTAVAWYGCTTAPAAANAPSDVKGRDGWQPITLPGTPVELLAEAQHPDDLDWWFGCELPALHEPAVLVFDGLATLADVWVGGEHVATAANMFRAQRIALTPGNATSLTIRCRSLNAELARRRPRPRWKASIVAQQQLRWFRTTLLGRMPGIADTTPVVGPWRAVRLVGATSGEVIERRVHSFVDVNGLATAEIEARVWAPGYLAEHGAHVTVGDRRVSAAVVAEGSDTFVVRASVTVPDARTWWPHTHGEPTLYPVALELAERRFALPSTGFRVLDVDRAEGGFTILVNGVKIFCRGVCWVPPDPVRPATAPDAAREALTQLRAAGFNMVRLTGTNTTESDAFYDLCDELGLLVWHDCMISTLDLPHDDEFEAELSAEVRELCSRLAGRPAVCVVSGGTETWQQPAMLGLSLDSVSIPAVQTLIPSLVAERLPGVHYVESSPFGGDLPFQPDTGIAHYFGVGAYLRPLSDATLSGVRFAAECLAFAVPPERTTVDRTFGSARFAGHAPEWKRGVPRDRTASWDFEDVRDHYVRELFGVDPMRVRYEDADRYLDLGRAACAEAMRNAFAQWRAGSVCDGALILTGRDLVPGAGWGIVDSTGRPKAPWYALRRVLAPITVALRDGGLNGIRIDLHNDSDGPFSGSVQLRVFSPSGTLMEERSEVLQIPPRSLVSRTVEGMLGHFRDVAHAYRFGPPTIGFVSAALRDPGDMPVATDSMFTVEPRYADAALSARTVRHQTADGGTRWTVVLQSERPAQWVAIESAGYLPSDNWFHLAPGDPVEVVLSPVDGSTATSPSVTARCVCPHQETSAALVVNEAEKTSDAHGEAT